MTPLSFEWQWSSDYFLFMGFLYLALLAVGCGLAFAYVRTWLDLRREEKEGEAQSRLASRSKYSEY
jgi:TRAP-type C4-dicarboxylate transport system permease small subunit